MPQIETWSRLPPAVRDHLIERMHDRNVGLEGLNQLRLWIESKPTVPEGAWYRDFGSLKLCGRFYRPIKQAVSMRLDADVVAWLKKPGKGYQTRANSILRQRMSTDARRLRTRSRP